MTQPNPISDLAKVVADELWERAVAIADTITGEVPVDQTELDDETTWLILEHVALELSPSFWTDQPSAIHDLYNLRKKFAPALADENLKVLAQAYDTRKKALPDPMVSPANPTFQKQMGGR